MDKVIKVFEDRLRKWGAYIIGIPIFLMAMIETLNAFGRKLWVPFPCAVETVESLLVITTYFGASIVAIERGHVNVDLVTTKVPAEVAECCHRLRGCGGGCGVRIVDLGRMENGGLRREDHGDPAGSLPVSSLALQTALCPGPDPLVIQLVFNIIKMTRLAFGRVRYAKVGNHTGGSEFPA